MRRYLYITGTIIAVALVAWGVWFSIASSREPRPMSGVVTAGGTAALEVRDQLGAQDALTIDRVVAPEASWIAVYLQGMGGMTGAAAGLTPVSEGETRNLRVPLDPGVRLTDKVIVVLHADRGVAGIFEFDPGAFDASPDKPYFIDGAQLSRSVNVRFSEMGNSI